MFPYRRLNYQILEVVLTRLQRIIAPIFEPTTYAAINSKIMEKPDKLTQFENLPTTSSSSIDEESNGLRTHQFSMANEQIGMEYSSIKWKKPTESLFLIQQMVRKGISPRNILSMLYPMYFVPSDIPDMLILQLLRELCEQNTRKRIQKFNQFDDVVHLFRSSKRIMIITGAGVSVSCGIPDFRSENGIYARLHKDYPELPNAHAMFDIGFFSRNPTPFYSFAREIFPGQFRPSISHMFIKFLEEEGKLLRNYTQNIDTLERIAGINNLVECHGSFARSTCLMCKREIDSEDIRELVFDKRIPYCSKCKTGVIKPNIVFFGEELSDTFHAKMGDDHDQLDLLVVIGSSLQVRPVSLIPYNIAPEVPQILINRELLPKYNADIKLLGDCDQILAQLALAIGGSMREKMVKELQSRQNQDSILPSNVLASLSDKPYLLQKYTVTQFKKIIGAMEKDEPETKKPRTNGPEEGVDSKTIEQKTDEPTNFWEGNFVLVESQLPTPNSTILIPPNLNVFRGAKFFYDRDNDNFVHRVGKKQRYEEDEDMEECHHSSDGNSTSSNSTCSGERGSSLPPYLAEEEECSTVTKPRQRESESCPPFESSEFQKD